MTMPDYYLSKEEQEVMDEALRASVKVVCDPAALKTRLERLEKALRFYAEKENYIPDIVLDCGITEDHISKVTQDAGTIAREALSTESSEVTDAEVGE